MYQFTCENLFRIRDWLQIRLLHKTGIYVQYTYTSIRKHSSIMASDKMTSFTPSWGHSDFVMKICLTGLIVYNICYHFLAKPSDQMGCYFIVNPLFLQHNMMDCIKVRLTIKLTENHALSQSFCMCCVVLCCILLRQYNVIWGCVVSGLTNENKQVWKRGRDRERMICMCLLRWKLK